LQQLTRGRLAVLGALAGAFVVLFLTASAGNAQIPPTPIPTPVPTPYPTAVPGVGQVFIAPSGAIAGNHSICGKPNPLANGGQTIYDSTGSVQVTLTEAGIYSYGLPTTNVGQAAFSICHVPTNSTVVISLATGKELARTVRDGLGHTILNRIMAGVQLTGAAYGSAAAPATGGQLPAGAASPSGVILRPPSTGDGGLVQ
jgi:hypothetical protein